MLLLLTNIKTTKNQMKVIYKYLKNEKQNLQKHKITIILSKIVIKKNMKIEVIKNK